MAAGDIVTMQGPLSPSKLCFTLPGGNDSCATVNDFTASRVSAGDTKGTFTAWIMMDAAIAVVTQAVIGNADASIVEFLDITIESGLLTVRSTDNTTAQFVTQADSAYVFKPYTWYQIAVVQAADGHGVRLYINGKETAATNDTATNVNSWYGNLAGLDTGFIGASSKGGAGAITEEFRGFIGSVKYWNSALTADEIQNEFIGGNSNVTPTAFFLDSSTPVFTTPTAYSFEISGECYILPSGNAFGLMVKLPPLVDAPVVADDISIAISGETGTAVIVKAA